MQILNVEKLSYPWMVKYGVSQQKDYSVLELFQFINCDKF